MSPTQAFRASDVPVITVCFDTQNPPDVMRNNLGRKIDDTLPEPGHIINDARLVDVAVRKVPRRVFDLLMKGEDGVLPIQLQNPAGRGVVGPETEHGDDMTPGTIAMG